MKFFNVSAWGSVDDGFDGFFQAWVARVRFEQARAGEEEFAVEFEDFVKFGGDV